MSMYEGIPIRPRLGRIEKNRRPIGPWIAGVFLVIGLLLATGLPDGLLRASGGSQPTGTPSPTARAVAPPPTSRPTSAPPTATPAPSITPTPVPLVLMVANTGGLGVYIRRTPSQGDRIKAWGERTLMVVIGEDRELEGRVWRNVRDPQGNQGWIPAQYLTTAPEATATATPTPGP